jgi:hypothetical protein
MSSFALGWIDCQLTACSSLHYRRISEDAAWPSFLLPGVRTFCNLPSLSRWLAVRVMADRFRNTSALFDHRRLLVLGRGHDKLPAKPTDLYQSSCRLLPLDCIRQAGNVLLGRYLATAQRYECPANTLAKATKRWVMQKQHRLTFRSVLISFVPKRRRREQGPGT